ncbi:hypothetical protein BH09GEM1_BH09GEM1_36250 [soil metagenome]
MDEREAVLERAIETLRILPEVRPEATARLLIAIAAERQRDRETREAKLHRRPRAWIWSGLGMAAAAAFGVFLLPTLRHQPGEATAPVATVNTNAVRVVNAAQRGDGAEVSRAVELVFSAPGAKSVRVAGDFNGWNELTSPMVHDHASGLWNVTLMLRPGRHVYAFVVNDTQWVRDPRTPAAPDADFGRPGSVVLVGRP